MRYMPSHHRHFRVACSVFVVSIFTCVAPLWAGGLYLQEYGTPSMGTASAGAEAIAVDASTALHNPAGMTRVEGQQLMLGGGAAYSTVHFDRDPSTPFDGGNGGDAGGWAPLMGAYYTHSLSDRWSFGFGLFTLSGAALDYDNDWTGRYQCQDVSILTLYVLPSLAYQVTDQLSVAAGAGAVYGDLELDVAVPRGSFPDGQATLDGDDVEFVWNLSALYEISERTRVGIMYFSESELEFSGDLKFDPSGLAVGTDTDLPLAQFIRAGVYHDLNDKWALLGTVAWEEWSTLDNVNISTGGPGASMPRNWDDTWHYAMGVHYRPSEKWLYQAGIAYDDSPVSATYRTADMPIDEQWRYAIGVQHQLSERTTIGAAFEYVDAGDAEIDSAQLVGEYDRNAIYVLGLYANWKW